MQAEEAVAVLKQTATAAFRFATPAEERLRWTTGSDYEWELLQSQDDPSGFLNFDAENPVAKGQLPSSSSLNHWKSYETKVQHSENSAAGYPDKLGTRAELNWVVPLPAILTQFWKPGGSVVFAFEARFERVHKESAGETYWNMKDPPLIDIDLGKWADKLVSLAYTLHTSPNGRWFLFKQAFAGIYNPLQDMRATFHLEWTCSNHVIDNVDFRLDWGCHIRYSYYVGIVEKQNPRSGGGR